MKIVSILDYGTGNITSLANAFARLGAPCQIIETAPQIQKAEILILAGVGSFEEAMRRLERSGLGDAIRHAANQRKIPVFGICLGMQIFAETGMEPQACRGLGLVKGSVTRMENIQNLPLPHVGWNEVEWTLPDTAPRTLSFIDGHYYFDHSFVFSETDAHVVGTTLYGKRVTAAIWKDNIFGTQFHPEKSHLNGLRLVKKFLSFANDGLHTEAENGSLPEHA
ncbi:imidazole glycerol phosphate synthase subunit HisH [Thalassospira lucentensis]|uniref:imidazole glycerol phosphate synthase subunit HisH n=1 Tax=Thalassospira lucentensis TaxID=168935 RepID=UPI003D2E9F0B